MTPPIRFIEVIALTRLLRVVETYEAVVELTVSTGRRDSCFEASIALREEVLEALKSAGIEACGISDGGGGISQSMWSASKSVTHRVVIRHESMQALIRAMAAVERLFVGQRRAMCPRIKRNFTFHTPVAVYSPDVVDGDAIRDAVRQSRAVAQSLAEETGAKLGAVYSVTECDASSVRKEANFGSGTSLEPAAQPSAADDEMGDGIDYTSSCHPTTRKSRLFRIRFRIDEEPDQERLAG